MQLLLTWGEAEERYLEQALPLGQGAALHGPEVDVRFSTGDDQVCVHGMKHGRQHRLVGALLGGRALVLSTSTRL